MKNKLRVIVSALFLGTLVSFTTNNNPTIVISDVNNNLSNNQFELKDNTYFLNKSGIESLFVDVKSEKVSGKKINNINNKKESLEGTKYTLNFYEKCNSNQKKLSKG